MSKNVSTSIRHRVAVVKYGDMHLSRRLLYNYDAVNKKGIMKLEGDFSPPSR